MEFHDCILNIFDCVNYEVHVYANVTYSFGVGQAARQTDQITKLFNLTPGMRVIKCDILFCCQASNIKVKHSCLQ